MLCLLIIFNKANRILKTLMKKMPRDKKMNQGQEFNLEFKEIMEFN